MLPVFLLMLFGLIDGARYVFVSNALSNAAREGARKASVEASWIQKANTSCGTIGGPVCPADAATLKAHVLTAANQEMAPFGSVTNLYISCDDSTPPTGQWTTGTACTQRDEIRPARVRARDLLMVRVHPDHQLDHGQHHGIRLHDDVDQLTA